MLCGDMKMEGENHQNKKSIVILRGKIINMSYYPKIIIWFIYWFIFNEIDLTCQITFIDIFHNMHHNYVINQS